MTQKAIVFDAGPIIGFTMNGLLQELTELKKIFSGKFLITEQVKEEIIDRPINIKRFELEALKVQELINQNIFEFPESLGITKEQIENKTNYFLDIANSTFLEKGKDFHLIDKGEASALALSQLLKEKNIKNIIVIDERTTRLLVEKPENLKKILQKKLHTRIETKKNNFQIFKNFKIVRSAELAFLIYKKGLTKIKNKKILEAMLYGLKYKGCSISTEEINSLKKMIKG